MVKSTGTGCLSSCGCFDELYQGFSLLCDLRVSVAEMERAAGNGWGLEASIHLQKSSAWLSASSSRKCCLEACLMLGMLKQDLAVSRLLFLSFHRPFFSDGKVTDAAGCLAGVRTHRLGRKKIIVKHVGVNSVCFSGTAKNSVDRERCEGRSKSLPKERQGWRAVDFPVWYGHLCEKSLLSSRFATLLHSFFLLINFFQLCQCTG